MARVFRKSISISERAFTIPRTGVGDGVRGEVDLTSGLECKVFGTAAAAAAAAAAERVPRPSLSLCWLLSSPSAAGRSAAASTLDLCCSVPSCLLLGSAGYRESISSSKRIFFCVLLLCAAAPLLCWWEGGETSDVDGTSGTNLPREAPKTAGAAGQPADDPDKLRLTSVSAG